MNRNLSAALEVRFFAWLRADDRPREDSAVTLALAEIDPDPQRVPAPGDPRALGIDVKRGGEIEPESGRASAREFKKGHLKDEGLSGSCGRGLGQGEVRSPAINQTTGFRKSPRLKVERAASVDPAADVREPAPARERLFRVQDLRAERMVVTQRELIKTTVLNLRGRDLWGNPGNVLVQSPRTRDPRTATKGSMIRG